MGRSPTREERSKRGRSESRERNGRRHSPSSKRSRRSASRSPDRKSKHKSHRDDYERSRDHRDRRHRDDRERDRDRDADRDRDRDRRHRDRDDHRARDRDRRRSSQEPRRDRDDDRDRRDRDDDREQLPPPPAGAGGHHGGVKDDADGAAAQQKKAEPLSLEELLKKRQEEKERQSKPVFLTKKQREELALTRRAESVSAQRGVGGVGGGRVGARDEFGQRIRETTQAEVKAQEAEADKETKERELQLEMIKKHYLGEHTRKKRITKPSEKFRFTFEWDASEDTSRDLNPLYNNPHEAALLFGRGMRAGIDRREQRKALAEVEKTIQSKVRDAAGMHTTEEDKQRDDARALRADKYDGYDMKVQVHWSEKAREDMNERDWRIFREDYNISYRGGNPTLPIRNWEEAHLPDFVMQAIERHGYKKPSPIQMAAIPLGLQQRDVIGIAETGSGKTAAFVLPMLCYIMKQPVMKGNPDIEAEGPYAVVLAPTRELAQQIEEETRQLAYFTEYRVVSVVGGQSIEDQGFKLRKGCEIVVGTPGRLVDCLERSYAVLNQCNYVVLDEADRMIDMGFEPQVQGVLDAMPSSNLKPEDKDVDDDTGFVYRTTYMFSATMPPAVERLARKYMRRPVVVQIGTTGRATDNVTQRVLMVKENEKPAALEQELEQVDEKRAIVFVNTKRQCDAVTRLLEDLGFRCTILHGGKTQDQREASLAGFREDKYNVLVATDVAGRGIDVPDVALVVNYDMAHTIEAYTHRVGRTGRAGRKGKAVTFLTGSDTEVYYDLKKLLEESKAPVPPQLAHHEAAKIKPGQEKKDKVVYAKK